MALQYKVERKSASFFIRVEEKGSRKVLYIDSFKKLAKPEDLPLLEIFIKIKLQQGHSLDTIALDRIDVPFSIAPKVFALLKKTARVLGLEEEGGKKEEPLSVKGILKLVDASGSFANFWLDYGIGEMEFTDFSPRIQGRDRLKNEEKKWLQDLLDAGFSPKIVGSSQYFCPKEKVKEALLLLLEFGWTLFDYEGKKISPQIQVTEEKGKIAVHASLRAFIDLKIQMSGIWEGNTLHVPRNQILALSSLRSDSRVDWQEEIRSILTHLSENKPFLPITLPSSFQGKLLPFQEKGVEWLFFLYRFGFSALLADEMGLGKTVQVLAFLSLLRTNFPVLIVAPTSLLLNWQKEAKRFLHSDLSLLFISYTELRMKIDFYQSQSFEVVIFDESSAIKTPQTQTFQAAAALKARFKICLNGTPMENKEGELLTQFQLLMPDLIQGEKGALKQQIRPFMMRRKKEEVAQDLPEKIEQTIWLEMKPDQAEEYHSFKEENATALVTILRLRQLALDPRLLGLRSSGIKTERVIEDAKEALEEGRKVLIYSQFTSMLQLLREEFPTALYLDGSMSGQKREEMVSRFQEGEGGMLFLLSLKAGGVGLNLTQADYVFLLDPWWNDAVENQAIDRAHRIGRKGHVIARRYAVFGTIEEKMLQLKEKKSLAAEHLLDFEGKDLSEEDLLSLL